MAKEKCTACKNIAGKSKCKLQNGNLICPFCCVGKRNDICSDCDFYQQSKSFISDK